MNIEKMREQFEAWHSAKSGWEPRHYDFYWNETYYEDEDFQCAWEAWKASREAVMVELPDLDRPSADGLGALFACKSAIEALGLKVKP